MTVSTAALAVVPAPDLTVSAPAAGPRAGRPVRRKFPDSYKRRIVAEYDEAGNGEKGAILRREHLYTTHITTWRNAINAENQSAAKKRGRPADTAEEKRIKELEALNASLQSKLASKSKELDDANAALDILGKGVAFLEMLSAKNAK